MKHFKYVLAVSLILCPQMVYAFDGIPRLTEPYSTRWAISMGLIPESQPRSGQAAKILQHDDSTILVPTQPQAAPAVPLTQRKKDDIPEGKGSN